MFKSDEQIQEIVEDAKAFLYERSQVIGIVLSGNEANNLYNSILNSSRNVVNLIKAIEFIGATDNNKLSDRIQLEVQQAGLQKNYVEEGYVTQGYVKSNQ